MTTVVPVISRLKLGRVLIVRAMLELYHAPLEEWDEILELAREARKRTDWQMLGVAAQAYVVMESEAVAVQNLESAFVPGLLQTEDYAREVFGLDSSGMRRRNLAIRLKRRERLVGPNPLVFHAIVDETALRRPIGEQGVRRGQLDYLIEQAQLSNVTLQVLPLSLGANLGMRGAFSVLRFPPDSINDIGNVEHAAGSLQIIKPDQVSALAHQFRTIADTALPQAESLSLIARIARQNG